MRSSCARLPCFPTMIPRGAATWMWVSGRVSASSTAVTRTDASEGSDRVAGLVVLHHHPALPAHPDPLEIGEDTWYLRRSEVPVVAIGLR